MSEQIAPEQPVSYERATPLVLNLDETAQIGVFEGLTQHLRMNTSHEVRGMWEPSYHVIPEMEEVRNIVIRLAENLGRVIDPLSALNMGITQLIPDEQLQEYLNLDPEDGLNSTIIATAKYFVNKKASQEHPQE